MRKKFLGANWKMNLAYQKSKDLYTELSSLSPPSSEVVIFPSTLFLSEFASLNGLPLGAQDVHFETYGAFTGSVSPLQLKSISCEYVLIGHSERRQYFNENNVLVNLKLKCAIQSGLKVIFCCGEPYENRKSSTHLSFVLAQIKAAFNEINETDLKNCIIAYEPIWAIGTGLNASQVEIEEMHGFIRESFSNSYGTDAADGLRIIYGGSCNQDNASAIFSYKDVDGGLVGAASLDFESFQKIITAL